MDSVTISLFAVLEASLLLGVAVVFLWRSNKCLRRRIQALRAQDTATPKEFASVESGYLAYLEQQILDTRAQLELTESEADTGSGLTDALGYRLALLEAEMTVTGLCNDYPERRWEHVAEHFQPPAPVQDEPESSPPESEFEQSGDAEHPPEPVEELQALLGGQGELIQSLMQVVTEGRQGPGGELVEQLEGQLLELERRYREATTCVEIMRQENARLKGKVERKDQRIDRIEKEKTESVADLQQQLGKQRHSIDELHDLVGELQLEAEVAEQLKVKLDQFNLASRDMNMCIQVLEEENEFLQEQVRSLLQMDEGDSVYQREELEKRVASGEQKVAELEKELQASRQKISEWEQKYASMEQEYLTLYEETNS